MTINQMPPVRSNVRKAIVSYLQSFITPGTGQGYIPHLASVFDYPAKVTNEGEMFTGPGVNFGAAIWLFFPEGIDSPVTMPANYKATGVTGKASEFQLRMICQFVSNDPESQVAGEANEEFLDGLANAIRFDPTAGTGSNGSGTGVIFQWGLGPFPRSGPDIRIECYEPKAATAQIVTIESHVHVSVVTQLDSANG